MSTHLPSFLAFVVTIASFVVLLVFLHRTKTQSTHLPIEKFIAGFAGWALFLYLTWGCAGLADGSGFHQGGLASIKLLIRSLGALAKAI